MTCRPRFHVHEFMAETACDAGVNLYNQVSIANPVGVRTDESSEAFQCFSILSLSQPMTIVRSLHPLDWHQVAAIAVGSRLVLSDDTWERIGLARDRIEQIARSGTRAYGVNTGVGALCDEIIPLSRQYELSRHIVMSHAVGVGAALGTEETRAIMAAAVNNHAHGYSGIRPKLVRCLLTLLEADCVPEVPAQGSVGYLVHMAHIALVCMGSGRVRWRGKSMSGAEALRQLDLEPIEFLEKEGLSLINGTPCATGLGALALARARRLLDWADAIAAMSFENLGGQVDAFDERVLALRVSEGLSMTGARLRHILSGSALLAASAGQRTQDPLSLRAIPHVHGAARDVLTSSQAVVNRELASVTDNPVVMAGETDLPHVHSQAHAVGVAIAMSMDSLSVAVAHVAAMAERRTDRLVNPLVSGLPAFLAKEGGAYSGLMIAQYTAAALVAENRRDAMPASLDGGITSGLQEDHLSHATPAAFKLLKILENCTRIFAIELVAATQAYDLNRSPNAPAPYTGALREHVRRIVPFYQDDRPLADDINAVVRLLANEDPPQCQVMKR